MEPNDSLAAAVRTAQEAHAATLATGTDREILTALRAALVAEQALYASCSGKGDQATAQALGYEIEIVDRDLSNLK